jgi:predicted nucleic acid-binding protein
MIVLDTNVISEVSKPLPDAFCASWLSRHPADTLFLTDMTIMELIYGAEKYRLKTGSLRYVDNVRRLITVDYLGRILSWDEAAVRSTGLVRARREKDGHSMTVQDSVIAAICLSHGATLATRNVRDFEGLDLALINPFEGP